MDTVTVVSNCQNEKHDAGKSCAFLHDFFHMNKP